MDISRPDLLAKKRRRQFIYIGSGIIVLIAIAFGLSAIEPAAPKVNRSQVWIDAVKRGVDDVSAGLLIERLKQAQVASEGATQGVTTLHEQFAHLQNGIVAGHGGVTFWVAVRR